MNFWTKLNKPIFALAPMADVTDFAFREMFAKYGKSTSASPRRDGPDVMFTEFVNVDGLTHPEGFKRLSLDLKFSDVQRPMVAQIWGRDPQKFFEAAKIISDLKFDGVDINFGCPQDKEIGQGTCAALIREPKLAQEIILATMEGFRVPPLIHKRGLGGDIPVSVKTRLGYSKVDEMESWLTTLLETSPAAITLHARTKQEKSKVPAHWDEIKKAVEIRDQAKSATLILGNGDVKNRAEGLERVQETACDGLMIGRGAFGNPWLFRADGYQPTIVERLKVMLEHAEVFEKEFGGIKPFQVMRKHFKAYASGFDGASELRAKLMETKDLEETKIIVGEFLRQADL